MDGRNIDAKLDGEFSSIEDQLDVCRAINAKLREQLEELRAENAAEMERENKIQLYVSREREAVMRLAREEREQILAIFRSDRDKLIAAARSEVAQLRLEIISLQEISLRSDAERSLARAGVSRSVSEFEAEVTRSQITSRDSGRHGWALALLKSIQTRGGPTIAEDFAPFGREFRALLRLKPDQVPDLDVFEAAVTHAFGYFTWKWDPAVLEYLPDLDAMIAAWSRSPKATLNILCILADFHYFVVWCFNASSEEQCRLSVPVMRQLGARFAKHRRNPTRRALRGPEPRIVWLAAYAESHGPISVTLLHFAKALLAGKCELIVYAWREHDEEFLQRLRDYGATCRVFSETRPQLVIEAIERELDVDLPDIAISDMNNAIPTALFARRAAPAQIFLQIGPPAWPVPGLDAVFNGYGFDPELAGWGSALQLRLDPPWDYAALVGSVSDEELAAERALFPPELRLIGSYGRLVKVTTEYLQAAETILKRCPDAALILGGNGDPSLVRDFIARSPVAERMFLEDRFVSKHVWGQLLTVFLDTWPLTGGESAREMLAKGKPIVTLWSAEMPAIHQQRDPTLVAADWTKYENLAVELLTSPPAYVGASSRARKLAVDKSDPEPFTAEVNSDVRRVLAFATQNA